MHLATLHHLDFLYSENYSASFPSLLPQLFTTEIFHRKTSSDNSWYIIKWAACRGWSNSPLTVMSWCLPADRDEVFSLHADAPSSRLLRCQTHSHCRLNAPRLHPAAAPGPLWDPWPGQVPSLPSCVLQIPALLCGELLMLLLEEENREVASIRKVSGK